MRFQLTWSSLVGEKEGDKALSLNFPILGAFSAFEITIAGGEKVSPVVVILAIVKKQAYACAHARGSRGH